MVEAMMDEAVRSAINAGHCPDCKYRGFVLGPKGGASINIECGNTECRHRFNVVTFSSDVLRADRIDFNGEWASEPLQ